MFHLALENKGQAGRKSSRVRISRGTSSLSLRKKQGDLPKSMRMWLEHTAPYLKGSRKPIFERTRTQSILGSWEVPQGTQHRQTNKDVHKHECSNKLSRLGDAGGWLEYDDNFFWAPCPTQIVGKQWVRQQTQAIQLWSQDLNHHENIHWRASSISFLQGSESEWCFLRPSWDSKSWLTSFLLGNTSQGVC